MNLTKLMQKSLIVLILLMPALWSTESLAGSVSLILARSSLTNVADAAGGWQYEGGNVFKGATQIGYYSTNRRTTTSGTTALNTAMVTTTLFLNTAQVKGNAPRNITIQGAWDFTSGGFLGSVSSASSQYNWLQGADVAGVTSVTAAGGASTTLTIDWLQSFTLTLP